MPAARSRKVLAHGDKPLEMLAGVTGDLDSSLRQDMTNLCDSPDVNLPPDYGPVDPYSKGLTMLYCFKAGAGPGESTGLAAPINRWCMINELQSQTDQNMAGKRYESTRTEFVSWAGPAASYRPGHEKTGPSDKQSFRPGRPIAMRSLMAG
ncbi:uncharacterized protein AKAW2_61032A [Aspergillus luchuensis]|uniref:Uncharacterized protein n=2 Tax=Aspergillus kawachii TaxID=1069201 RepID=A0A146FYF2_ASPKA|nr:uncharacterized protein AKAW2_61032A [Aspergillus luchuensis]OJZ85185.1 hypothetical protein ASPFODRAFT_208357 [Aspergillus luchuensis CBS 106.47]GAA86630.1 hypothetical protein AKAW_04744 [Aspergillus luchuensis IFO 4308]BCS02768.1 hypothetical protein AKAW2_61032A [Aspergillus luchuensis]BCS14423.1 hypothetical protein ALUC_60979A [Aspergillus luchuensis]GAT30059.1 hypothetical protein RIB2604_03300310 [Aspergillus luchuensis]